MTAKVYLTSVAGLAMAVAIAYPVAAQTAMAAPPPPSATAGAAADEGITEIVVTAQKRSESAQRIPLSVTAISGANLAQQGVKDLFQAVTLVPGVVFSRAPDDGLALTFRGLGTQARPQAFEQSVALFIDGVFIGKSRLYATSFFDIDRMEFIKGTQSTLLGKNASLGAISVISRQPGDRLSFEGRAGYEAINGGYMVDGAADVPISSKVSLRVAGHYNDLNGWVRNDVTGHKGPERKDLGLRATLKAELTDTLTVTGSYQHANNEQLGSSYQLIGNVPLRYGEGVLDGHTAQFTALTRSNETEHQTKSDIGNLRIELQMGDHVLSSQTAYVHYNLFNQDDFDFTSDDTVNFQRAERYKQFTQEFRIQSPAGNKVEYMAGVFYLNSTWNSSELQAWSVPGFPPAGGPPPGQLFNGPFTNNFDQKSKAYSGFAAGTWHISDRLRLAGGVRFTREEKDVVFGRIASAPFTVWNTIANPQFDPTPLQHNSSFWDGNVSLQYDIAPRVIAYAAFGHGSKSGGFVETNTVAVPPQLLVNGKVPAALVASGSAIRDEFTKSYEVGLKTTLLDGRMRLNIAGFWTDIKDFQDTVFTGGALGFLTSNGPARSRGVEIETAVRITSALQFDGGLTYADATGVIQPIDPTTSAPQVDASGNAVFGTYRRSQAPKLIFNAGATYDLTLTDSLNARFGASVRHRSSMFNQRQELFLSPQLTTVDLSIGIEASSKRWGVDVVAKNINNSISQDFASPSVDPRFGAFYGAYLAGPNQLRTVMLSAHVKY